MSLSQTQIIQSLAQALSWFEKELDWGVSAGELNHLTGRIGELYAAMITRGQMALETNQRGYDIISADNERVSVKTVTTSTHVTFNSNTFDLVDRVIVLRINIDDETGVSVETLLDEPADTALNKMRTASGNITFSTKAKLSPKLDLSKLSIKKEATYQNYFVRQYENDTIEVLKGSAVQPQAKPHLRKIAEEIGVDIFYGDDKQKNTRQLGSHIIAKLNTEKL